MGAGAVKLIHGYGSTGRGGQQRQSGAYWITMYCGPAGIAVLRKENLLQFSRHSAIIRRACAEAQRCRDIEAVITELTRNHVISPKK